MKLNYPNWQPMHYHNRSDSILLRVLINQRPYFRINVRGRFIYYPSRFKDGVAISPDDKYIIQTALPDGTIKLNIEKVTPADCGAYKLVISNPHGDNSALCAVAVNRKYKLITWFISKFTFQWLYTWDDKEKMYCIGKTKPLNFIVHKM